MPFRLIIDEPAQEHEVAHLAAAAVKYDELREASGLGARDWSDGRVLTMDNVILARISYNGRLWNPDDEREEMIVDRNGVIVGSMRR